MTAPMETDGNINDRIYESANAYVNNKMNKMNEQSSLTNSPLGVILVMSGRTGWQRGNWQMERKTARVSKEPEVRRQEILDTAMVVFMEKGYEAATMRDIAAAMHVVPGLCYRYFESKQVLYDTVIEQYVADITYPMIRMLEEEEESLEEFLEKMERLFLMTDGKEKYHHFFHKKENHGLQMLLSVKLCETIEPYMEAKLQRMRVKGIIAVENIPLVTSYMLFGAVPVLENDSFTSSERAAGIRMLIERILRP